MDFPVLSGYFSVWWKAIRAAAKEAVKQYCQICDIKKDEIELGISPQKEAFCNTAFIRIVSKHGMGFSTVEAFGEIKGEINLNNILFKSFLIKAVKDISVELSMKQVKNLSPLQSGNEKYFNTSVLMLCDF